MMPSAIPQTDPRASYVAHRDEIDSAVRRVLENGRYILGPEVEAFEAEFARYIGAGFAVAVASGTDALELALRGCGVGPGCVVYTVSHTAVATVAAIELCGATPVLVDIEGRTLTMDPACLAEAIEAHGKGRPGAVVPVHLYGHPADMPAIVDIAHRSGLAVIEDCAQSHGATLQGRMTGLWGDAAAFSFYPTKNLGAFGDGGAVVTKDEGVAERIRTLRQYGWRRRYVSDVPGVNSRLDELQAAILRVKLPHLAADNDRRRKIADSYSGGLNGVPVVLPHTRQGVEHAYHQYVIRTPARDSIQASLASCGIGTLVHYPEPVHLQPAYAGRVPHGDLRQSEIAAREVLSLPMYPELEDAQVSYVVEQVRAHSCERRPL